MHRVSIRVHGYKHPPKKIEKDLTQGPLLKQIILYSIPLVLTSVLLHVFKTADIAVLGIFVGDRAVAAVGSTASLISLLTMFFIGISIGVNVVVSRCIGEHNEEGVLKAIGMSIPLSLIFGLLLIVVGQTMSRPMLELMGCDPNVIDLAERYLKVYFWGVPLVVLYNFMSAIMRASGDTVRPLIYLIIGGVLNVPKKMGECIRVRIYCRSACGRHHWSVYHVPLSDQQNEIKILQESLCEKKTQCGFFFSHPIRKGFHEQLYVMGRR